MYVKDNMKGTQATRSLHLCESFNDDSLIVVRVGHEDQAPLNSCLSGVGFVAHP